MKRPNVSIIIPAFNEEKTVEKVIKSITDSRFPFTYELIVVNDGSSDATGKILRKLFKASQIIYLEHESNSGKGLAVRTGMENAKGDYILIQDADLEYNPKDIPGLFKETEKNPSVVVYGSRLTMPPIIFGPNKTPLLLHFFGNKVLSFITSMLYGNKITDMETGYKLFPKKALKNIRLKSKGFEFEPEITAKLLKNGYRIIEIPITTKPRSFAEGKKLHTVRDGIKALTSIVKYRFID